jgi:hypothetical protein
LQQNKIVWELAKMLGIFLGLVLGKSQVQVKETHIFEATIILYRSNYMQKRLSRLHAKLSLTNSIPFAKIIDILVIVMNKF